MHIKGRRATRNCVLLIIIYMECCVTTASKRSTSRAKLKRDDSEPPMISYKGYQLWQLQTDTVEKFKLVNDLDIVEVTRWGLNGTNSDVLISPINIKKVQDKLAKKHVYHTVLMKDLQEEIDRQPVMDTPDMKLSQKYEPFNLSAYHNLGTISFHLHTLCDKHSHVKLITIGKTIQGNSIQVVAISNKKNNKGIFIEGGIHAREWISHASVLYLITHFARHLDQESQGIQSMDWYFLPVSNPDGYIYSYTKDRLWRKNRSKWGNCFGTDLNRNFGYHWSYGDPDPCEETFSGSGAFSERETQAIHKFITKFQLDYWKAYISVHSYGQYVLFPYGYGKVVPNNVNELTIVAQTVIEAIKKIYKTEYSMSSVAEMYIAEGVSVDWSESIGIPYSYTIELRDTGKYAFLLPDKYIIAASEELLTAVEIIAESAYRDISKKSVRVVSSEKVVSSII